MYFQRRGNRSLYQYFEQGNEIKRYYKEEMLRLDEKLYLRVKVEDWS